MMPTSTMEQVYPRECGGTTNNGCCDSFRHGLSPRVRGNPSSMPTRWRIFRSIPASAGEPTPHALNEGQDQVYPRECGGTPGTGGYVAFLLRSIPASAGEPQTFPISFDRSQVYPRECGGTEQAPCEQVLDAGLSPRVRGNLSLNPLPSDWNRSIPASAGEPSGHPGGRRQGQVYPRECGGTVFLSVHQLSFLGLSPRVRGNPTLSLLRLNSRRSIPASAGEPLVPLGLSKRGWVYPRECGGTGAYSTHSRLLSGLSPRVRGNRLSPDLCEPDTRSIPASAGEPLVYSLRQTIPEVYPRECGGTHCQ